MKIYVQNFYCLSISYKGAIKNSYLLFWKTVYFRPIFAPHFKKTGYGDGCNHKI